VRNSKNGSTRLVLEGFWLEPNTALLNKERYPDQILA
jgi:hypothetical protein